MPTTREMSAVAEVVRRLVAAQAMVPVEAVTLAATPEALGLDSLGLVEVVFGLEEAFDIKIPFNANERGPRDFDISSVASIVASVERLIGERGR